MPVRLRITILFTMLVLTILLLVCGSVYYFSYTSRINNIKTRLTSRAVTTANLLSKNAQVKPEMLQKIHAATNLSLTDKTVQVYNSQNQCIYIYKDEDADSLTITPVILKEARSKKDFYFTSGTNEAVAYYFTDENQNIVVIASGNDENGKIALQRLRLIIIISLLASILLSAVLGYIFSGRLLRPIKKIADKVTEISAQDLSRRIETGNKKDEWNYLSTSLNQLLNRLQESFETQRRFISNASHELSTPLTSISSQLEVSLQNERKAEDYKKTMQSVYQDVRHLSKLTQTLLEFAKASGSAGGIQIDLVRIDEVLMRLPAEMQKLNYGYTVSLQFNELPEQEEELLVFGNEELLFTAIKNVVSNACKYSENHTAIVKLAVDKQKVNVQIEDSGKGIPENELNNIFQPFYRTDESRSEEGFGLGLSMAYRIIKLHKGVILVNSSVNKGSVFTVELPAASTLRNF
ncbi:MAG: HAMP domain-containing histidine kinase [Bacteroidetes bacterium]|nr:HAMP domain-containing histidine kinase [Bacteroidota bacterium]